MTLPPRSVLAGGLAGLAAWGISLGLVSCCAITVPPDALTPIVTMIGAAVMWMVPDTKKQATEQLAAHLDMDAKDLAAMLPTVTASYPVNPNTPLPATTNIVPLPDIGNGNFPPNHKG